MSFAEGKAKLFKPTVVMMGDSLTVGGVPWDLKLRTGFFDVLVSARAGLLTRQVALLPEFAPSEGRAKFVILTSGSNDVIDPYSRPDQFYVDYAHLIQVARRSGYNVIITLIPPTTNAEWNEKALAYNLLIRRLAAANGADIIDLWPILAPRGLLQSRYTVDGVHLTSEAYRFWSAAIRAKMARVH